MHVEEFVDQYDLLATVMEQSPTDVRDLLLRQGPQLGRWLAIDEGVPVGTVRAWRRPDQRTFLTFSSSDPTAYQPLIGAAAAAVHGAVHANADDNDSPVMSALTAAGFETEMISERFQVWFDSALGRLRRAWVPSGVAIHSADSVDLDRLFTLDNIIRNDVPGTEGWRGNRRWFRAELADEEFDADGYLVAVDQASDEYIGLVRMWRKPSEPYLGLVGVIRQHRGGSIAAALLRQALSAAAGWGSETFGTHASISNPVSYPALLRLDAEPRGRFRQLVRP
jgi:GNAT superfamily N-acetyltransferase